MQLRHEPVALVLSRQALPTLDRTNAAPAAGLAQGRLRARRPRRGGARRDPDRHRSEVGLALSAHEKLAGEGHQGPRRQHAVVGALRAPATGVSRRGPAAGVSARVAVEQASTFGWERYVGDGGAIIGMDTFGASAPLKMLQQKFGFTPDVVSAPGT